ncbi:MAG: hypothetical protein DRJ69_02370 [Thermoprotei archaeon]|nr:MAG: hypothetical protein DRJ69_02370 [Thermoprotei archaeon]
MQVNITFARHEAHLYEYLRAVAGERGISKYLKGLIEEDMLGTRGVRVLASKMLLEKVFKEWAWCPRCGAHGQFVNFREEKKGYRFFYWCPHCEMGYSHLLTPAELSVCEQLEKAVSKLLREGLPEEARKRQKTLELLRDRDKRVKALVDKKG